MPLAVVIRLRIRLTHRCITASPHHRITASPHHRIKGSLTGSLSFYRFSPLAAPGCLPPLPPGEGWGEGMVHSLPNELLTQPTS